MSSRQESNLDYKLRKLAFYPLNYGRNERHSITISPLFHIFRAFLIAYVPRGAHDRRMFSYSPAGSRGVAQLAFVGLVALVGLGFAAGIAAGVDIGRESQVAAAASEPPPSLDDTGGAGKSPGAGVSVKAQCNSMEVNTLRSNGTKHTNAVAKCFNESTGFDGVKRKMLAKKAAPGCELAEEGKCIVRYCVPAGMTKDGKERCFIAKKCEAGDADKGEKCVNDSISTLSSMSPKDALAHAFKTFSDADRKSILGALRPDSQKLISDAFKTEAAEADAAVKMGTDAVKKAEEDLKRLSEECGMALYVGSECSKADVDAAARKLEEEKENLRKAEEYKKKLTETAKYLEPDDVTTGGTKGSCAYGLVWKDGECYVYKDGKYEKVGTESAPCAPGQIKDTSGKCVAANTFNPPPETRLNTSDPGPGRDGTNPNLGGIAPLLSALAKLLGGTTPQQGAACPTDQNAYAQYQQQYNQQLQQYNAALQQYNYQVQVAQLQGLPMPPAPTPPTPCTPSNNTSSSSCASPPAVPTSACSAGWKPTYGGTSGTSGVSSSGSQCITGWQCGSANAPVAQLSCQPDLADIGMTVALSFGCQNATTATGQGFSTNGELSGSTTTVIANVPQNATAVNFALTCTNQGAVDSKQCSVRINKPSIVLVANPKIISSGQTSSIGWVTAGIESCVVSSPDNKAFTDENAGTAKKSSVAQTPALSQTTSFVLDCTTLAGSEKQATTTVTVQ